MSFREFLGEAPKSLYSIGSKVKAKPGDSNRMEVGVVIDSRFDARVKHWEYDVMFDDDENEVYSYYEPELKKAK